MAINMSSLFGGGDVSTFLGLPSCSDLATLEAKGVVLGVPGVTPYASIGAYCANGPKAIRDAIAGDAVLLPHVDFDGGREPIFDAAPSVVDHGDLAFDADDFQVNRTALARTVGAILDHKAVPILLGGDDSLPIPMFQAYAGRGRYTVLQIDAHIDWRDEVQGETQGLSSNMRRASEMGHIERIIQVGQRSIGSARTSDVQDALDWGAHLIPARQVARDGIQAALDLIPTGANVIVALDADGLDPSVVPGVIGRAPGGLSYWQVVELIEGAATRGRLAGFEVAEFVPERDIDGIGALNIARIVANVIRLVARGPA